MTHPTQLADLFGLDIDGLGDKQVEQFFEKSWIETPADIFRLSKIDEEKGGVLAKWEGWGEQSVGNLFAAIEDRREIDLYRFFFGLGIR